MKRTLSLLALGALVVMPATGRADDSIGDKAADMVHGIGEGIKDTVAPAVGDPTKHLVVELTAVAN